MDSIIRFASSPPETSAAVEVPALTADRGLVFVDSRQDGKAAVNTEKVEKKGKKYRTRKNKKNKSFVLADAEEAVKKNEDVEHADCDETDTEHVATLAEVAQAEIGEDGGSEGSGWKDAVKYENEYGVVGAERACNISTLTNVVVAVSEQEEKQTSRQPSLDLSTNPNANSIQLKMAQPNPSSEFTPPADEMIKHHLFRTLLFDHHSGSTNPITPPSSLNSCTPAASVSMGQDSLKSIPRTVSPAPSVVVGASSSLYSTNQQIQHDQTENNTESLATSSLDICQHVGTLSSHVRVLGSRMEELDPVFVSVAKDQDGHISLASCCIEILEKIERMEQKFSSLMTKVDENTKFNSELTRKVELLQASTRVLVRDQQAVRMMIEGAVNDHLSAFRSEILKHFDNFETSFQRSCQPTIHEDKGFESDFEDEDNPLTQVLFPQGNGRFDPWKNINLVTAGQAALETGATRVSRGRERFERGFVKAGRGGGGGAGWCTVM